MRAVTAPDPGGPEALVVSELPDLPCVGIARTEGLRLKVGQKLLGPTGFVYCIPNGCVAEFSMDEKLVTLLKSGQEANFIIFSKPEEGIGIPVSLAGFGQGLDKLP